MRIVVAGSIGSGKSSIANIIKKDYLPSHEVAHIADGVKYSKYKDIFLAMLGLPITVGETEVNTITPGKRVEMKQINPKYIDMCIAKLRGHFNLEQDVIIEVPEYDILKDYSFLRPDFVIKVSLNEETQKEYIISKKSNYFTRDLNYICEVQSQIHTKTNMFGPTTICFNLEIDKVPKSVTETLSFIINSFKLSYKALKDNSHNTALILEAENLDFTKIIKEILPSSDKVIVVSPFSSYNKMLYIYKYNNLMCLSNLTPEDREQVALDVLIEKESVPDFLQRRHINSVVHVLPFYGSCRTIIGTYMPVSHCIAY